MDAQALPLGVRRTPGQDGDSALYLEGSRCTRCGAHYFPARTSCPACVAEGVTEPVPLGNRGEVYSYTVVHVAPKGFTAPYILGYVDLPTGVRLLAHLVEVQPGSLTCGVPARLTVRQIGTNADGTPLEHYAFVVGGEERA